MPSLPTARAELLVQLATFDPTAALRPEGSLLGRLLGLCTVLIGAVAWVARISSSRPLRRAVTGLFLLHLLLGIAMALLLFPIYFPFYPYTIWLMALVCVVLFVAYFWIWLYVTTEF